MNLLLFAARRTAAACESGNSADERRIINSARFVCVASRARQFVRPAQLAVARKTRRARRAKLEYANICSFLASPNQFAIHSLQSHAPLRGANRFQLTRLLARSLASLSCGRRRRRAAPSDTRKLMARSKREHQSATHPASAASGRFSQIKASTRPPIQSAGHSTSPIVSSRECAQIECVRELEPRPATLDSRLSTFNLRLSTLDPRL